MLEEQSLYVNIDSIISESVEKNIIDNMSRKKFYQCVKNSNIVLNDLFINSRKSNRTMEEVFNAFLKKCNIEEHLEISDMLIFLEKDYCNLTTILSLLDDESKFLLKQELSEKYNMNLNKNLLSSFVVD